MADFDSIPVWDLEKRHDEKVLRKFDKLSLKEQNEIIKKRKRNSALRIYGNWEEEQLARGKAV